MTTYDWETINGIVTDLLSGGESAEQNLCQLTAMKPELSDDCSGLLLLTLQWGIQKYGRRLQEGLRFFKCLRQVSVVVPNRFELQQLPAFQVADGGFVTASTTAFLPRHFRSLKPSDNALASISATRERLSHSRPILPTGLTILSIGFSVNFAVEAVVLLSTVRMTMDVAEISTPIVVLLGKFIDVSAIGKDLPTDQEEADVVKEAIEVIQGGMKGVDLDNRIRWLHDLPSPRRASPQPGPIRLGSSIGTIEGCEDRGTAGVYVTPITSKGSYVEGRNYLLTAAHVMMTPIPLSGYGRCYEDETKNIQQVYMTVPGRLDVVRELYGLQRRNILTVENTAQWVTAARKRCGEVIAGRIGSDKHGWREDWCLVDLDDAYRGSNQCFWEIDRLRRLHASAGGVVTPEFIKNITNDVQLDLDMESTWYKDGASTGWTAGKMSRVGVELFLKETALSINKDDSRYVHESNVISAQVALLLPANSSPMAISGDSGAGLFSVSGSDLSFGGIIVSIFDPELGESLVMAVPSTNLLAQLESATTVEWMLS